MHISIISGSHRDKSNSLKVSKYIAHQCREHNLINSHSILDLATADIPMWHEDIYKDENSNWNKHKKTFQQSDAFIFVTPEWGGMATPILKNIFLLATAREFGHKPGLIVTVSTGIGGTYPVSELRSSSYKNNRICFIPEHVIVRNVNDMLETTPPQNKFDIEIRARIDYSINLLVSYADSLKQVRASGLINHQRFTNGM